jgi:hypothetical protein
MAKYVELGLDTPDRREQSVAPTIEIEMAERGSMSYKYVSQEESETRSSLPRFRSGVIRLRSNAGILEFPRTMARGVGATVNT